MCIVYLLENKTTTTTIHEKRLCKRPFSIGKNSEVGFVDDMLNIIEWTWGITSASSVKPINWKLRDRV